MDCSKTKNYLSERDRMCRMYNRNRCSGCPLGTDSNGKNKSCHVFENCYASKAIEIVQKWSNEHPPRTLLTDFLEKYPKTKLNSDGFPSYIVPCSLGLIERKAICKNRCLYFYDIYDKECRPCQNCWNTIVKESEEI